MKTVLAAFCWAIPAILSGAEPPGRVLDLTCWKLTLPVDTDLPGRPDEVEHPRLATFHEPAHFFVTEDGEGCVFRAPCGGISSRGSSYPRCELREMQPDGKTPAAWATNDGAIHTLTATLAITQTPLMKKHVVCAQIHDAADDVLMIRLEGNKLFVERESLPDTLLEARYELATPFELTIQATDGRIDVRYNSQLKLSWPAVKQGCYFKAGCYTQSNLAKGDAASAYGEVIISRLQLDHSSEP